MKGINNSIPLVYHIDEIGSTSALCRGYHKQRIPARLQIPHTRSIQPSLSMFFIILQLTSWYNIYLDTYPLLTKSITTGLIGLVGDALAQVHEWRLQFKEDTNRRDNATKPRHYDGTNTINGSQSASTNHTSTTTTTIQTFNYNIRRGVVNILNNLCITTPIYHYGYDLLEVYIPNVSWIAAFAQVLIDCIIFDAIFVIVLYISAGTIEKTRTIQYNNHNNAHNNKSNKHPIIKEEEGGIFTTTSLKSKLLPTILTAWHVNIFMIPIEYILFRYFPLKVRVIGMNVIDLIWDGVVSFALYHHTDHDDRRNADDRRKDV